MRMLKFAVVTAVMVLPLAQVQASILGGLLSFNGTEEVLVDESRAAAADLTTGGPGAVPIVAGVPAAGDLSTGDIVFGFLQFTSIDPGVGPSDLNPPTLGAIFSAEVGTITGDTFSLVPVADAGNPLDLRNLAPTMAGAADASKLDDAIFLFGSSAGALDFGADINLATPEAELLVIDSFLSYDATGGFDPLKVGDPDFFEATLKDSTQAFPGFTETGGFSILDHVFGPGTIFLPVATEILPAVLGGGPAPGSTLHDVAIRTGDVDPTGDGPWLFADNASFAINPVPEASAFIVWGLLGTVASMASARRRKLA